MLVKLTLALCTSRVGNNSVGAFVLCDKRLVKLTLVVNPAPMFVFTHLRILADKLECFKQMKSIMFSMKWPRLIAKTEKYSLTRKKV